MPDAHTEHPSTYFYFSVHVGTIKQWFMFWRSSLLANMVTGQDAVIVLARTLHIKDVHRLRMVV